MQMTARGVGVAQAKDARLCHPGVPARRKVAAAKGMSLGGKALRWSSFISTRKTETETVERLGNRLPQQAMRELYSGNWHEARALRSRER